MKKLLSILIVMILSVTAIGQQIEGVYEITEKNGQVPDSSVIGNILVLQGDSSVYWGFETADALINMGTWHYWTSDYRTFVDVPEMKTGELFCTEDGVYSIVFAEETYTWYKKRFRNRR